MKRTIRPIPATMSKASKASKAIKAGKLPDAADDPLNVLDGESYALA